MAEQMVFKLFDIYDVSMIQVKDPAMRPYINVSPRLLLKSQGRKKKIN